MGHSQRWRAPRCAVQDRVATRGVPVGKGGGSVGWSESRCCPPNCEPRPTEFGAESDDDFVARMEYEDMEREEAEKRSSCHLVRPKIKWALSYHGHANRASSREMQ